MMIQELKYLKSCGCIGIIAVVLLIMSIIVAGCTQTSSDNSSKSTAVVSPTDTSGNSVPPHGGSPLHRQGRMRITRTRGEIS